MAFTTLFHEVLLPDRLEYGMRLIAGNFGEEIAYTKSGYRSANIPHQEDLRQWSLSFNMETLAQAQDLMKFHLNRKSTAYGFRIFDHIDFQATDENFGRGDGTTTQFNLRKIYRDSAGQLSGSDISFANTNSRITSATTGFFKDILADSFVYITGDTNNNGNNGLFLVSSVDSAGTYFDVKEVDGSAADITTQGAGDTITVDMFVTTKRIYKIMEGRFVDSDYPFSIDINGVLESSSNYSLNENTGVVTFTAAPSDGDILTWSGGHHWPVAFQNRINLDYDKYNRLNLPDITVEEMKIFTS